MNLWLAETGISSTTIGQLAFIHLPYSLKFLWAPFIDQYPIPFLTKKLGKRRSWLLTAQLGLALTVMGMSQISPLENLTLFALYGFLVSFFAATQDLVLGGYRIEILSKNQQGIGTSAMWTGYRIGIMISGSGALYLTAYFTWSTVYLIMSCVLALGMIIVLINPEPQNAGISKVSYIAVVKTIVKNFIHQPGWIKILAVIFFYKVGDSIFISYTSVFLFKIGFSNIDISQGILWGTFCSVIGGFLGGILIDQRGPIKTFKLCGYLQILTCITCILQSNVGPNKIMLFATTGIEHFYIGIAGVTFYSFLGSLCTSGHTATQYAILSSLGSLSRILSSYLSGWAADQLSWDTFFLLTSISGIFYIVILNTMQGMQLRSKGVL
jgi:PAT family beta-lactamase induction signal transducer AmpG